MLTWNGCCGDLRHASSRQSLPQRALLLEPAGEEIPITFHALNSSPAYQSPTNQTHRPLTRVGYYSPTVSARRQVRYWSSTVSSPTKTGSPHRQKSYTSVSVRGGLVLLTDTVRSSTISPEIEISFQNDRDNQKIIV